ncbi:hypothetical protein [Deinococcus arenicola]|uniref:Uncharacterized protein n=1 Tax=Deinococcus arenicola TaxID=2994950 RepID=A0ABU4DP00_9DEIO|nr:hypothetical protein [Deinococcus sp. ZS9-10]MDV6374168.1 hypothetical protein [Deinococcus sp. ZS9-10]
METGETPEFHQLPMLGMAVRVALHLRGLPLITYDLFEKILYSTLSIPVFAVEPVTRVLAEAEFVVLNTEGPTIKSVLPTIPLYEDIFDRLGDYFKRRQFREQEVFTVELMQKLSASPISKSTVYNWGAEQSLVDRVIEIGDFGSFIRNHRTRGRNILVSPTYFTENATAYADLAAQEGAGNIKKVLELLKSNPGWPIEIIQNTRNINGHELSAVQLNIVRALAGEGFLQPPMIETAHSGANFFLFGPTPNDMQIPVSKRPIYEAALALVASMRQGQLLPAKYAIHSPIALLTKLRNQTWVNANTEAMEQYRKLAIMKVAFLKPTNGNWAELHLIDRPENIEAVDLAITLLSGHELTIVPDEDVVVAFREGHKYLDSLLGRKRMRPREGSRLELDEESQYAIDSLLMRGV